MAEEVNIVNVSISREVLGKKHLIKQDVMCLLLDWFSSAAQEEHFTTEQINMLFGKKYSQFKKDFEEVLDNHIED